jgi:hypothetical protein
VHTPAALADAVAAQVTEAAATAARLLFRDLVIDFPLTTSIVRSYADAGKPGAPARSGGTSYEVAATAPTTHDVPRDVVRPGGDSDQDV